MGVCNETAKRQNPSDTETSKDQKLQNSNTNIDKLKFERKAKKRLTMSK